MNEFIKSIRYLVVAFMLLFCIEPVMGETGTIEILDEAQHTYSLGAKVGTSQVNWSKIYYDTSNYNTVEWFRVRTQDGNFGFNRQFESTTFTCNGENTCTGVFYYDANTSNVTYVFTSSNLVSSPFNVTFTNQNVPNNITNDDDDQTGANCPSQVSSVKPVCLQATGLSYFSYTSSVGTVGTDSYTITYPVGGYFTVDINKNDYVSSKYFINSYNGSNEYARETTFNKVDIEGGFFEYDSGISFNITLSSGYYTIEFINASGCDNCTGYVPAIGFPNNSHSGGGSGFVYYNASDVLVTPNIGHNNTDIQVKYDLRFKLNESSYDQYSELMKYYIQMSNPDNTPASSRYNLYVYCVQDEAPWWDLLGLTDQDYWCDAVTTDLSSDSTSRAFFIDPPTTYWLNQTYSIILYEEFGQTVTVLDTDTFNSLNYSGYFGGNSNNVGGGGSGGIQTPSTIQQSGRNSITNILGFVELPVFWGLVFIIGALYYLRKSPQLILPYTFILINIEGIVGLLDPYAKYIIIVTWIIMSINFIFVQRKTTG